MSDLSKRLTNLSPAKRELLARLIQDKDGALPRVPPIPRRGETDTPAPLSFSQERLWFLHQLEPETPLYNAPATIRLTGLLSVAALEQSLNEIVRRHEILRTNFATIEGQAVQIISSPGPLAPPVTDLQEFPPADRESKAMQLICQEAGRPFDLGRGPLLRASLLRMSEREHLLLLTTHHIVLDGWSFGVLLRELVALYEAYSAGRPSPLGELPIQYADFAQWQRQWLRGETLETQVSYWRKQLSGSFPLLPLPTDNPRPAVQTFRGAKQSIILSRDCAEALKALSQREGATLFMTLLAAFKTLLYRYSGQEDILVGTPIANRARPELEALIGFFANTLVLRTDLSGNPTFRELLGRVREVSLGAYDHQDLTFEKLVEALQPERDLSHPPLFQVMFTFQDPGEQFTLPELTVSRVDPPGGVAKFDLTLEVAETGEGLKASLEYNTDLFEAPTIIRMLGHLRVLLEGVIAAPEQRLSDLPLLTKAEEQRLLIEWNETKRISPEDRCAHRLFEAQVERTPAGLALICGQEVLTYGELNRRANQLAHYLRSLGVGAEVRVALCLERSVAMMVGLLGILKAGGAYLPLDPSYPPERLAFMLEDAQPQVLLTQEKLIANLPPSRARLVCLDRDWGVIAQRQDDNPLSEVTGDHPAYVIYTSGSTGKPKGAVIKHHGLCNLSDAQVQCFGVRPTDRVLQFASLSFDASIFETMMALGAGAALCLAMPEELLPGPGLIRLLRDQQITNVTLPPSALTALPPESLPALRTLIVAGEACPAGLVARWSEGRQFFNAYGPTETTVWASVAECKDGNRKPPIGRPITNTQLYLLDGALRLVPVGVAGELYIGGEGLARGYLHRAELTAERFIPHPFSLEAGARLYRTGDLARYLPDGNIEYLGRIDHQVKVRGFRIELGEVEAVLATHRGVRENLVMAREDVPGEKRLVAYVVPSVAQSLNVNEVRSFLKDKLPEYMVPAHLMLLDSLPLTSNGKVDRKALPDPGGLRPHLAAAYIAPQTEAELKISAIWGEILRIEKVGIHDNFFDLGGHSLLMLKVHAGLQARFDRELSLITLFKYPTVSALAKHLSHEPGDGHNHQRRRDRAQKQRAAIERQQRFVRQ